MPRIATLLFVVAALSLLVGCARENEDKVLFLRDSARAFVDSSGTLEFEEVLQRRDEIFRDDRRATNLVQSFAPNERIWLSIPLPDMQRLSKDGWRGVFGVIIKEPRVARVEAFIPGPNGVVERDWDWKDERRLAGNGFRYPFIGFDPSEITGGLLFLRISTRMPFQASVWLADFQNFFGNYVVETTLLSAVIGVKVAILLYILALGFSLRSETNLWLGACMACGLLYVLCESGFLEVQLWPGHAEASQALLLASRILVQAAILMFAVHFLRFAHIRSATTTAARIASAAYLAVALAGLAMIDMALAIQPYVMPVLGTCTVLILAALSVKAARARRQRVVFFAAAWTPALAAAILWPFLLTAPNFSTPPFTEDGVFLGISLSLILFTVFASFDVRQREMRLRRQILHNFDRFRGFAEIGTDSFWEIDGGGRLTFLSGERGGPAALEIGDVLVERLEAASSPDYVRPIRETIGGLLPFDDRRIRLGNQDRDVWLSISGRAIAATPDRHQADAAVYRGLIRDVTEETERESRRIVEQQMLALGQLVGSVAHEVNNLIHPIINLTKRLRKRLERSGDEESERLMELIDLSSRQAAKVVSELLRSTRDQRWKDIDRPLSLAVEYSVEAVRPALPATVKIDVVTEDIAHPTVKIGDVLQIVGNLVSNAVHAMDGRGQISVALAASPEGARLTVADDGAGMEESVRQRAMQPFFTTKTDGRGTGVGLSVVQKIVRDYGGWITIDSAPGIGTTFTILFPERKEDDGDGEQGAKNGPRR